MSEQASGVPAAIAPLRDALAIVAALLVVQYLPAASWADEDTDASAARSELDPRKSAAIDAPWQAWWRSAQEELFAGIELTAEQQRAVEAILAEASADRARARELEEELAAAQRAGDEARIAEVRVELEKLRPRLSPPRRIDAMGELLTEDQRAIFDKQRRLARSDRLFAEQSQRRRPGGAAPRKAAAPRNATPEPELPEDIGAAEGP